MYSEEYRGFTVEVHCNTDPSCNDPRGWDNLGTMVCWHRNYVLGDERPGERPEAWLFSLLERVDEERARRYERWADTHDATIPELMPLLAPYVIMLPLFLFDHSGLSISTDSTMFRAFDQQGWDWGQVGWIYVDKEKALKEWKRTRWSKKLEEKVIGVLVQEVETYDAYLKGEVYGFVVNDADGNRIDSCWGFVGPDEDQYALEQGNKHLPVETGSFSLAAEGG